MKSSALLTVGLFTQIASSWVAVPAQAALVYHDGDLFLGFHASAGNGASQDYLVDIGLASQFTTVSSFTLSVGDIGLDLGFLFGNDWNTRGDVAWGISGTNLPGDPANTLYATRAEPTIGTPATAWIGRSSSAQGTTNTLFLNLAGQYAANGTATGNSSFATIQNTADSNSYASFQPGGVNSGGVSFKVFSPSIEGNFGSGTAGTALDLFRITPVFNQAGQRLGTFTINDSGSVTYTGSAVPEPNSALLLVLGGGLLGLIRRRPHQP